MTGKKPDYAKILFFFWGALFAAMLLKYSYYGFTYFPVLDDNNQYGIFSFVNNDIFQNIILRYKTYATRPLAALLDAYIIAGFWGNLWAVLLTITVMHFLSCYLTYKIFEKNNLKLGMAAMIIFGLLPFSSEATYWISASSRIVTGLFFTVLSLYFLMLYIERLEKKDRRSILFLLGFFISNLISLGFYEQVIAFSVFGAFILLLVNIKRINNKLIYVIPFFNLAVIGLYYKIFSAVDAAKRGKLIESDFLKHFKTVSDNISKIFIHKQYEMYWNGLKKGLSIIITEGNVIFIILTLLTTITFALLLFKEKSGNNLKRNVTKVILGVALFLVPFAPFFVLEYGWIVYRNFFLSFLGLGIIVEAVIDMIFKGKFMTIFKAVCTGLAVLLFLVINTAELSDYRNTSLIDSAIAKEFISTVQNLNTFEEKRDTILFNIRSSYIQANSPHIGNITGSDWGFMGAVQVAWGKRGVGHIQPVKDSARIAYSLDRFNKAVLVGMDEQRNMHILKKVQTDNGIIVLETSNGIKYGEVKFDANNMLVFKKAQER